MKNLFFLLFAMPLFFISCDDEEIIDPIVQEFPETALINVQKDTDVAATVSALQTAIENEGFTVVKTINHSANATASGLTLEPTQVIIFGNPAGGTQLMQADQRMGIDLPLKVLVWEDITGATQVSYYNAETLADRYEVGDMNELIDNVNAKLAAITGSSNPEEKGEILDAALFLKTKDSDKTYNEVYDKVISGIEANGFTVMQEVKHDIAAEEINMELRKTRLIMFGNAEDYTRFMQVERQIGIDLPLKMLVWEDEDGEVKVSYYNSDFYTSRYDIDDTDDLTDQIDDKLETIAEEATED